MSLCEPKLTENPTDMPRGFAKDWRLKEHEQIVKFSSSLVI